MKTRLIMLVCSIVASSLASAQSYTINFDGPPVQLTNTAYAIPQWSESGMFFKPFGPIDSVSPYRLTRNGGGISACPENGTAYLQTASDGSLEFYTIAGELFNLVSVDLAEYSIFNMFPTQPTITFNGVKADGTIVSTSFTLDGIIDGTGPLVDFQTFLFGTDFSDLLSVSVPTQGYSLDNLVVIVPEPSVVPLLLLGLGVFYLHARKTPVSPINS